MTRLRVLVTLEYEVDETTAQEAYGTTDPLREGERTRHLIPTARSTNLVDWTYVGDAFTESTKPSWATPDAALWAPDIRYLDGT
jgi:arabinan endo-1,5-alpha-L-arabinosidase